MLAVLAAVVILAGCASTPKGPPRFERAMPDEGLAGYTALLDGSRYGDGRIDVTVRPMHAGDGLDGVFGALAERGYVIFRLAVENTSGARVIFKPSNSVLKTNALDYMRPLDYTDLYPVLGAAADISTVKAAFYDLDVTLRPGQVTERLLIFRPVEERSKSATLELRDIYVGLETVDVVFRFEAAGH